MKFFYFLKCRLLVLKSTLFLIVGRGEAAPPQQPLPDVAYGLR